MALSGARLGKHPIHPMLVVIPLGLSVTALVFDIVYARRPRLAVAAHPVGRGRDRGQHLRLARR
jgi:uncharacterized membrane protein